MNPLILLPLLPLAALAQLTPSPTFSPPAASAGLVASTDAVNTHWSNIIGNSLYFYDAQRSGNLSSGTYENRVEWRNDSCEDDGSDYGLDLSGGWYDAGDYIKATFPMTFTLFGISWGALTHGEGYGLANQTAYLDGTLRWGFDWLMKAHPTDDQLFVQVASEEVDNNYWGGDQDIPTPRPSYPINSSYPGTDAWAAASRAFAMGSLLYTPGLTYNVTSSTGPPTSPSLADSSYSTRLLNHAQTLYDVANSTTPRQTYYTTLGEPLQAYASSSWKDDLTLAALTLALATNDSSYYLDAHSCYSEYKLTKRQDVWNWDTQTPAIYVLFAEIASARPGLAAGAGLDANLTGWQTEVEGYFDNIVNDNLDDGYTTDGGLLYFEGDSDEASLNPAMAIATLMFKYAPIASTSDKTDSYNDFASSQVSYLLGANPMNVPYIVGLHPNSPSNPHSGPASGGTDISNIRTSPETESRVLYGAVVGGPLSSDKFWDWRDDWVQTEVALDYNAMISTLASMQLINGTSDPPYVSIQANTYTIPDGDPCDEALPCSGGGGGLSKGAKIGIAVGVVLGVLLLAGVGFWIWRKCRRRRSW